MSSKKQPMELRFFLKQENRENISIDISNERILINNYYGYADDNEAQFMDEVRD